MNGRDKRRRRANRAQWDYPWQRGPKVVLRGGQKWLFLPTVPEAVMAPTDKELAGAKDVSRFLRLQ